jgi:hypothetical protein
MMRNGFTGGKRIIKHIFNEVYCISVFSRK